MWSLLVICIWIFYFSIIFSSQEFATEYVSYNGQELKVHLGAGRDYLVHAWMIGIAILLLLAFRMNKTAIAISVAIILYDLIKGDQNPFQIHVAQ